MGLFELISISTENRLWARINIALNALLFVYSYFFVQKATGYIIILALFLASLSIMKIIYKEKVEENVLSAVFPLATTLLLPNNPFARFEFIIIFFIIIFSAWYLYQAFYFFDYIWEKNFFKIRDDWNKLDIDYFLDKQGKPTMGWLFAVSAFHVFLAYVAFKVSQLSIPFIHQGAIATLSVLLLIVINKRINDGLERGKSRHEKEELFKKSMARLIFLTFILYFFFDMLLEVYRIKEDKTISINNMVMIAFNFIFLKIAFKSGDYFNQARNKGLKNHKK